MNRLASIFGVFLGAVVALTSFSCFAGDRAQPSMVSSSHQFSSATQLYTYSYAVTNPTGSAAPVDTLVVMLEPGVDVVTNLRAPPGWRAIYASEKGSIMWAAIGFLDPEAEDPSGNIPPSDYAISPGDTLAGFSFDSFGPPGPGLAITQSYAPLYMPQMDAEFESLESSRELSTLPEDNGYQLSVITAIPDADWTGNRRPAVDGFLVFANVANKASFRGSVMIVLRLAAGGEQVDPNTLDVLLNSINVTGSFAWSEQYSGYAATFLPGASPLRSGTNVLITSVDGVVPGTTGRIATDTDRLTFDFTP